MIWNDKNLDICCLKKGKVIQNYTFSDQITSAQFIKGKQQFIMSTVKCLSVYSYDSKRKVLQININSKLLFNYLCKVAKIQRQHSSEEFYLSSHNIHSIFEYNILAKNGKYFELKQPIDKIDKIIVHFQTTSKFLTFLIKYALSNKKNLKEM